MAPPRFSEIEVLIVDDEEFSRTLTSRVLRSLGVETIRYAGNGFEGLQRLRYPYSADVVILDINMPLMSGLEMLRKIRDGSAGIDRDMRVAILSGHAEHLFVNTAQALDVDAFLVKPTAPAMLAGRLDAILRETVDLKPATVYAAVEIPRVTRLSGKAGPAPMDCSDWECPQPVKLCLENIPLNARLAEEVYGPDGDILLPPGIRLTQRLLNLLANLRALDDCVSHLTVELAVAP